jgi:hypothetical protein
MYADLSFNLYLGRDEYEGVYARRCWPMTLLNDGDAPGLVQEPGPREMVCCSKILLELDFIGPDPGGDEDDDEVRQVGGDVRVYLEDPLGGADSGVVAHHDLDVRGAFPAFPRGARLRGGDLHDSYVVFRPWTTSETYDVEDRLFNLVVEGHLNRRRVAGSVQVQFRHLGLACRGGHLVAAPPETSAAAAAAAGLVVGEPWDADVALNRLTPLTAGRDFSAGRLRRLHAAQQFQGKLLRSGLALV